MRGFILNLLYVALAMLVVLAFVAFVVWITSMLVPLLALPEPIPRLIYVGVGIICLIGIITAWSRVGWSWPGPPAA